MITVRYFARIRELLDCEQEQIECPQPPQVATVLAQLRARGGAWEGALSANGKLLIAVNQAMVGEEHALRDGDELAFFPPVTGG